MITEAQRLYRSAMLMLSAREHSVVELRRKLKQKGFDSEAIESLLADLLDKDWLSNQRYCEAYMRSRVQKGYGLRYIENALKQQGITQSEIAQALTVEPVDWYQLAIEVRHKRFGSHCPKDFKHRQKQQRFLQYRGFDSDQIQEALAHNGDA